MSDQVWDYRVVKRSSEDGSDEWYSIQEIYYDTERGDRYHNKFKESITGQCN